MMTTRIATTLLLATVLLLVITAIGSDSRAGGGKKKARKYDLYLVSPQKVNPKRGIGGYSLDCYALDRTGSSSWMEKHVIDCELYQACRLRYEAQRIERTGKGYRLLDEVVEVEREVELTKKAKQKGSKLVLRGKNDWINVAIYDKHKKILEVDAFATGVVGSEATLGTIYHGRVWTPGADTLLVAANGIEVVDSFKSAAYCILRENLME